MVLATNQTDLPLVSECLVSNIVLHIHMETDLVSPPAASDLLRISSYLLSLLPSLIRC